MDSFDGLNPNSKTKTKPVSPITQLVTILPKNSINLIPPVYHKLMKEIEFGLLHYYPEEYTLETIFKRYYWQCVPLLPPIDLDLIEKNVNKIKVSKEIKERFANGVLLGT
jgi:5'-3' exonuclease